MSLLAEKKNLLWKHSVIHNFQRSLLSMSPWLNTQETLGNICLPQKDQYIPSHGTDLKPKLKRRSATEVPEQPKPQSPVKKVKTKCWSFDSISIAHQVLLNGKRISILIKLLFTEYLNWCNAKNICSRMYLFHEHQRKKKLIGHKSLNFSGRMCYLPICTKHLQSRLDRN